MKKLSAVSHQAPPLRTGGGDKQPILYVEDEDPNWEIAEKLLRNSYDLDRARNSDETWAALKNKRYVTVLMDIQLGESAFSGVEIVQILTRRFADAKRIPSEAQQITYVPPIIFVTAYTALYTREQLMAFGGDELISKPIDFIKLTSAITRLILKGRHVRE